MMYKLLLKPLLFLLEPETAHQLTIKILKVVLGIPGLSNLLRKYYTIDDPKLKVNLWGLEFPNPVGLAAGFDKDGKYYDAMSNLGFGFIEIGTVTPQPQPGNEPPRLFRLPQDHGLINRMGFNNDGVEAMVQRLKNHGKHNIIIGGNIGKNKTTPNEKAVDDYIICFNALFDLVDYFVVNVSSPNTPGLRELQEKEPLTQLLSALMAENNKKEKPKPVLLKIAPDLSDAQLDDIIQIVHDTAIHGIIATNTTLDRSNLKTDTSQIGMGGLSGAPLKSRSTEVIRYIATKSGGRIPIMGVGGISTPEDALEKLDAGASLVQVYTGMIFEGPGVIKEINNAILRSSKGKV